MSGYKSFLFFSLAFATGLIFYTIFLLLVYKIFFSENKECEDTSVEVGENIEDLSAQFEDIVDDKEEVVVEEEEVNIKDNEDNK